MSSFEVVMPRFLSTVSSTHAVLGSKQSFLSNIKTYADWNEPHNGFKVKWKRELEKFRASHMETIMNSLSSLVDLQYVALTSLSESVNVSYGLINFIEDTYLQYLHGKFGPDKAWHVTTKLATALIEVMFKPRRGTLNLFSAGDSQQISAVIFYVVLRSLDKMGKIKNLNFKDHPSVNTELVKFLSLNTLVEVVDKLQKDYVELSKNTTATCKSLNTLGNKLDTSSSLLADLKKQVTSLEKK